MAAKLGLPRFNNQPMKKDLVLLVLLLTSACSFQVNTLEPQSTATGLPDSPTSISAATSTVPVFTPTFAGTLPLLTTDTVTPLSPITSVPSNSSSSIPIVFPPNATSEVLFGNVADNSSQAYSLNAFEGQIMSVSILPEKSELQNTFQLEIKGRDGAVLCPLKDRACSFWRGALPSTQEYRIKVNAQEGGAFNMLVAINPPGTVSQLFSYADPKGRFALSYPDDFAPTHFNGAQVTKIPPDFSLQYIDTQQYRSTNLSEVYFLVGVSDDPQQVSSCTEPLSFGEPETILGQTTANGVDFTKSEGGGVGAGNIYEQVYYRTVHNGSCYEVTYFVHYANIGNYSPGTVTEFDRTALYQQLDEILASLILR
jgi:hypothetical protein